MNHEFYYMILSAREHQICSSNQNQVEKMHKFGIYIN